MPSHARCLPFGLLVATIEKVDSRQALLQSLSSSMQACWVDRGLGTDALELLFSMIAGVRPCCSSVMVCLHEAVMVSSTALTGAWTLRLITAYMLGASLAISAVAQSVRGLSDSVKMYVLLDTSGAHNGRCVAGAALQASPGSAPTGNTQHQDAGRREDES